VSFQTAPPKAARPDPSQASESFGALLDSSTPTNTGNSGATSVAPQQSASQRRADDAAANADNSRSRDTASADQAARNNSDDRDAAARQAFDANAATNADASTQAVQQSRAKSSAPKTGSAKSAEKLSSDKTSQADASTVAASATQDGAAVTPNADAIAVAVAIPVTTALTDAPAVTPTSGDATAPLAIAAAAIAASSQRTAAPAATETATATASAGDPASAAATAAAVAPANTAATAATAKIAVQAAASEAVATPVKQQATQTDSAAATTATAVTEAVLTASVAATTPVAPKTTPLKAPVAESAKTVAPGTPETISGAPDLSAAAAPTDAVRNNAVQQPVVTARQETGGDIIDTAKADAAASSTSVATAAIHDHAPVSATANVPTDSVDAGAQATGAVQPQLPSAVVAAPPGPLIVTAAINTPVPLNGLALEIAASARSGKSRFEIRLDPADLGRIDIRIDVDRNGQVTSHLTVEKPETLSMLRQDAPQLQRALDDAGFKTGDGGLQFSLRDQSSSGQNNGNETSRNAQRLVISDEDTIAAAIAGQTYGRVLGSSSGVDIRV